MLTKTSPLTFDIIVILVHAHSTFVCLWMAAYVWSFLDLQKTESDWSVGFVIAGFISTHQDLMVDLVPPNH